MKRGTLMLTTVVFATLLLASGIGTAVAEPQKNQILVSDATCDDGEQRTFVINGEGNVGQTNESTSNIIIATSSFEFFAPEDRKRKEPIADPVIVNNGQKEGLQGDLITCNGEVTTELFRLGLVTVVYEFEGFVTP